MRAVLAAGLVLALAGCGERTPGDRSIPIRIPIAMASAATPAAVTPVVPSASMAWTHSPSAKGSWYGPANAPAQLAISCEGWRQGAGRLLIARFVPAEKGAEAVLAIQGSKGILRLPVSAVRVGKDYAWRGEIDAGDPRVSALLGAGLKITVPGGGMLTPPPMGAAGATVSECIAAAPRQILPNRPSNPAMSSAAR